MSTRATRDGRVNLRVSLAQLEAIRQAAESTDTTMTEFILTSAMQAADQVLADRRWFSLDDSAWEEFQAALDRPAVFKPRLAALLASPDPFTD
ncbi:MAG: hypothetical protein QG597_3948 [Actinomycetota bacterium]|nr:hypothetical protein [Actinomycetota bacterium]